MPGHRCPARRTLEKHLVGRLATLFAVQEVVEGHFVQRGGGGKGRDVAADARVNLFARTTMAMAFQRTMLFSRRSIWRSPG